MRVGPGTKVTNEGLVHLKGMTKLQSLWLFETAVTDAGLVHLKGSTSLQWLNLNNTAVTDAGLVHLKGLKSLQTLDLSRTSVTTAGVKDLQSALPKCKISKREENAAAPIKKSDGTGNFAERTQPTKESQAAAVAAIKELGGKITFDSKSAVGVNLQFQTYKVTDVGLEHLKGMRSLQSLLLDHRRRTGAS